MTARRFNAEGFDPFKYEYELRQPYQQQYSEVGLQELAEKYGPLYLESRDYSGGIRYRLEGSTDKFTTLDKKDYLAFYEHIMGAWKEKFKDSYEANAEPVFDEHPYGDAECVESQEASLPIHSIEVADDCEATKGEFTEHPYETKDVEEDGGTIFKFCCYPMMKSMLGGEGHVLISLETGRIQLGNTPMNYCPFCGKAVITFDPPIEVIPPEE